MNMPNYYSVLGVEQLATAAEIKIAYRRRVQCCHPDVCSDTDAAEQFHAVRNAYRFLSNPVTRRAIDILLAERANRLPHPHEVDRKAQRGPVLTTEGWLVKEL